MEAINDTIAITNANSLPILGGNRTWANILEGSNFINDDRSATLERKEKVQNTAESMDQKVNSQIDNLRLRQHRKQFQRNSITCGRGRH